MAKTTVEPVWANQREHQAMNGWFTAINRLAHQMVNSGVNSVRLLVSAFSVDTRKTNNHSLLSALIRHQQHKVSAFEQSMKEEFYQCGGFAGRTKVPGRVWKRHSALLVYREQVYREQVYRDQMYREQGYGQ